MMLVCSTLPRISISEGKVGTAIPEEDGGGRFLLTHSLFPLPLARPFLGWEYHHTVPIRLNYRIGTQFPLTTRCHLPLANPHSSSPMLFLFLPALPALCLSLSSPLSNTRVHAIPCRIMTSNTGTCICFLVFTMDNAAACRLLNLGFHTVKA